MDLALDGPFGRDEIARRAAFLYAERTALQGELDALGGDALEGRLRGLEALPALVEAYLRDLPDMVGRRRAVRGHETVPGENPLVPTA